MKFGSATAASAAFFTCLMLSVGASAETKSIFNKDAPPALPAQNDGPPALPETDGPPDLPSISYYIGVNGEKIGPLDQAALAARVKAGDLTDNTLVWTKGMDGWEKAATREDLTALLKDKPKPVVKAFDAKSFVVGKWNTTGSLMVSGLGMAQVIGEEIYAPNGQYTSNVTMTIDNPPASFVQAGFSPLILTVNMTGKYKVESVVDRNFTLAFDVSMTMRDKHGMGMQNTETLKDSSPVIAMDDNTIKNATEDLIARRVN